MASSKIILRYEVWASQDGSASNWKPVPNACYISVTPDGEHVKQLALERAEHLSTMYARVCVEEYDNGRNQYLKTVREYPLK